jgi:hypothetical protein
MPGAGGETTPGARLDPEPDLGAFDPRTDRHQDRAPLSRPSRQPAGVRRPKPRRGPYSNHLNGIDERGRHCRPVLAGGGYEGEPGELDPCLVRRGQAEIGQPDDRSPLPGSGGPGQKGEEEGDPLLHHHGRAPPQTSTGEQRREGGKYGEQLILGQYQGARPAGEVLQTIT